jgi:hypothetical protein
VTRLDVLINDEAAIGDWTEPDLVIALSMALEAATVIEQ